MSETNYQRLFGTPERAAKYLDWNIHECGDCPLHGRCKDEDENYYDCTEKIVAYLREEARND